MSFWWRSTPMGVGRGTLTPPLRPRGGLKTLRYIREELRLSSGDAAAPARRTMRVCEGCFPGCWLLPA